MGRINFYSEGISFDLKDKRLFRQWMIATAAEYGFNVGEISVVFVSDDHLLEMNRNYLQHDYYTDIITFDYTELNSGSAVSPRTNDDTSLVNRGTIGGDLFISYDRVKDNASKNKLSLQNEIQRVVIHGVLHLCGLKDKEKKEVEIMRKAEEKALQNFPKKLSK